MFCSSEFLLDLLLMFCSSEILLDLLCCTKRQKEVDTVVGGTDHIHQKKEVSSGSALFAKL
jgi:hypothetical protein